jgi:hypothetical protein
MTGFRTIARLAVITAYALALQIIFPGRAQATSFVYDPIAAPILSATFSADFAALTAHRTVAGFEVNSVTLVGATNSLSLSEALFGTADALSDVAQIAQGDLETGIVTAAIAPSFFAALAAGRVGLLATLTDTFDGLFAIDFLSLTIVTASSTTVAFIDSNDGFRIGIPDGGLLPDPLPTSIAIGATGTGFDESISSISFVPAPEPGSLLLVVIGFAALAATSRRRTAA